MFGVKRVLHKSKLAGAPASGTTGQTNRSKRSAWTTFNATRQSEKRRGYGLFERDRESKREKKSLSERKGKGANEK